ncbi:nucleotide-binding protein [Cryobacterium sp. PH31-L1]|uniref:nucleotide-binding protein n=1 Tax=Cryobacterium sp. PH31-L1 TaxID=3046199 RepID=UPI0024B95578|nr:nucleotide-binding protein [Cryobacterium sp. PH31-L1]MDJ0375876.1 nucleotide-binding protein [Cryobacterium sp. PH31-L1]
MFVVHGRNEALRKSMFDFLRSINLSPMEWSHAVELTGEGSPYIGQVLDAALDHAAAIVVLMTPDEIAYLQPQYGYDDADPETKPSAQARPNVLFEAGMALGRDPQRTILVEVGTVRPFSDIAGRHSVRLSNDSARRQELANRLRTAGCDVDLQGTDWHSTGDFTAPPLPGEGLPLGRRLPSNTNYRKAIDFDVKYYNKGSNRVDKLQIINRGTETALDVNISLPEDAALQLHDFQPIKKIPGGGRSVTIDVMGMGRMFGGPGMDDVFDVTVSARSEAGEPVVQEIFLDTNS